MPHSLSQSTQNKDSPTHRSVSHKHHSQHGYAGRHNYRLTAVPRDAKSILLGIPTESLTHITSYLDPASLFVLSAINRRLHEHVDDDNTWRRAYVYQFLGISPEDDIHRVGSSNGASSKALMLRREESTWKREFVLRCNLRRRWEQSKPTTISHIPVHSAISSIHLMPSQTVGPAASPALLTSSMQYGIVARSYPLVGKVLRGFLDASGTLNGLGIGNPNAEFSPDLTQCVLSAEGGTARILWGFRSGIVAVTQAQKAMESSRPTAARWMRCTAQDAHEGPIEHAVWLNGSFSNGGGYFVTGGVDGKVKLWDAKRVVCLWTSSATQTQLPQDPCLKVAADPQGIVAAAFKNGDVVVWSGLSSLFAEDTREVGLVDAREIRVPAPPALNITNPYGEAAQRKILVLYTRPESSSIISCLTAYEGEPYFYRTFVNLDNGSSERVAFGDTSMAPVSVVHSVFSGKPGEHSFVVVGDQLGFVRTFPWNGSPTPISSDEPKRPGALASTVLPIRTFEAYTASAVTAIAWTPSVILTGSANGSIKAFDSLTFVALRDFTSAANRNQASEPVKQIIVDRDFFAASVGNRAISWRGEPVGKQEHNHRNKAKRLAKVPSSIAKWHQQVEMYRDIAESRRELEYEQAHTRRVFGREREQQRTLGNLGLSEVEAVEYVLMLSRDEQAASRQREFEFLADEGVFAGSFDEDLQTPISTPSNFLGRPAANEFTFNGRTYPRPLNPISSSRLHMSPRLRPEPTEAGFSGSPTSLSLSSSISSSRSGSSSQLPLPNRRDSSHFPSMSSTPTHRSVSGSPESARSAWSTPLRMTRSEGPSSPRGGGSLVSSPALRSSGISLLSAQFERAQINGGHTAESAGPLNSDEDADLRFAIELSIAEARSRGEDV